MFNPGRLANFIPDPSHLEKFRQWVGYAHGEDFYGKRVLLINDELGRNAMRLFDWCRRVIGPERTAQSDLNLPGDDELIASKRLVFFPTRKNITLNRGRMADRLRELVKKTDTIFWIGVSPVPQINFDLAGIVAGINTSFDDNPPFFDREINPDEAIAWATSAPSLPSLPSLPAMTFSPATLANPDMRARHSYDKRMLLAMTTGTHQAISKLAELEKKSMSEVVREAVDAHVESRFKYHQCLAREGNIAGGS